MVLTFWLQREITRVGETPKPEKEFRSWSWEEYREEGCKHYDWWLSDRDQHRKNHRRRLQEQLERVYNSTFHPEEEEFEVKIRYATTIPDPDGWGQPVEDWSAEPDPVADEAERERDKKPEETKAVRSGRGRGAKTKKMHEASGSSLFMLYVPKAEKKKISWRESDRGGGGKVPASAAANLSV